MKLMLSLPLSTLIFAQAAYADDKACKTVSNIMENTIEKITRLSDFAERAVSHENIPMATKDKVACTNGTEMSVMIELFNLQMDEVVYKDNSGCELGNKIKSSLSKQELTWIKNIAPNIGGYVFDFCKGERNESWSYLSAMDLVNDLTLYKTHVQKVKAALRN